jgi:hypothetical protein
MIFGVMIPETGYSGVTHGRLAFWPRDWFRTIRTVYCLQGSRWGGGASGRVGQLHSQGTGGAGSVALYSGIRTFSVQFATIFAHLHWLLQL